MSNHGDVRSERAPTGAMLLRSPLRRALRRWAALPLALPQSLALALAATALPAQGAELASVPVRAGNGGEMASFDGVVQALRRTTVAAQVQGALVALEVKPGDQVKAGQVLLRLDARAAEQTAAAGDAQVQAARAAQQAAVKDFERQQQLFKQNYISQAALDRAEAQFKSTQADVAAQLAAAGATRTQSGFYVVKAPYGGVVAEVPVVLGDMAMPGRQLMTIYDPTALRVSVNLPQTAAASLAGDADVKVELPGQPGDRRWLKPTAMQLLPTVDPGSHTQELRLDLPHGLEGVAPGMFARAWLPGATGVGTSARLYVPLASIVPRAGFSGVYVIGADGQPRLRQVRLGRSADAQVEVLTGLSAGERVALDPRAAAQVR